MKETSRISSSRAAQGSRPSTDNCPSYEVRPRIALSAVVLPAPLGPTIPRMRTSSTCKSTPSSAMVVPNVLRRPRASMDAMASALLLFGFRGPAACRGLQQFFWCDAKPLNGCGDPWPFVREKPLAFALEQQIPRTGIDEHAATAPGLDQLLVDQLLIGFENRERIDSKFGRDIAHRGQRIAFFEHAVQYHSNDTVPKLSINRLTIVPLMHPVFHYASYSDVVNYNTSSHASFFYLSLPAVPAAIRYPLPTGVARAELVWFSAPSWRRPDPSVCIKWSDDKKVSNGGLEPLQKRQIRSFLLSPSAQMLKKVSNGGLSREKSPFSSAVPAENQTNMRKWYRSG